MLPLPSAGRVPRLRPVGGGFWGPRRADHDHFDVVPHLPVQTQIVAKADHPAIDPVPDKTLFLQVLEQVAVFAFLPADQGRSTRNLVPPGKAARGIEDLFPRLGRDGRRHCGQYPRPTRAYNTRR